MTEMNKMARAKSKKILQLVQEAMEYRRQLTDQVEATKVEMGNALANIETRENTVCHVCGRDMSDEEFLLLVRKTFFGDLQRVLQSSYMRMFFDNPKEYLAQAMRDIVILREYLISLIGKKCPAMPKSLTKIRIVDKVILERI